MFAAESTDGLCESSGEVEGGDANAVQSASRMTRAAAAGIIAQDRVEHIEATVLNVPVATQVLEQERGIGLSSRQANDDVGGAAASLALLDRVTFQAAAILLDGRGGLLLSLCFTHGVGAAEGGLSVTSNCATALDWRTKSLGETNRLCRLRGITKACSMSCRSCG